MQKNGNKNSVMILEIIDRFFLRYSDFLRRRHKGLKVLFSELGVGMNTLGIVKLSFWRMAAQNLKAVYTCINKREAYASREIVGRAACIDGNIGEILNQLKDNPVAFLLH